MHRPVRQLRVEDLVQAHPPQALPALYRDAGVPLFFQDDHGVIQHPEELFRLHRLYQVLEGPDGIRIDGVLRGDGEVDDDPGTAHLPEVFPQLDAGKAGHHHIQHIQVKTVYLFRGKQLQAGRKGRDLEGKTGAGRRVVQQQPAYSGPLFFVVITQSKAQHRYAFSFLFENGTTSEQQIMRKNTQNLRRASKNAALLL